MIPKTVNNFTKILDVQRVLNTLPLGPFSDHKKTGPELSCIRKTGLAKASKKKSKRRKTN